MLLVIPLCIKRFFMPRSPGARLKKLSDARRESPIKKYIIILSSSSWDKNWGLLRRITNNFNSVPDVDILILLRCLANNSIFAKVYSIVVSTSSVLRDFSKSRIVNESLCQFSRKTDKIKFSRHLKNY